MAKERQKRDQPQRKRSVLDDLPLHLVDPSGAFTTARWSAPLRANITAADGKLRWPVDGPTRTLPPASGHHINFFVQFLELAQLDPTNAERAVLRYAKRWGPLELCRRHGWPSTHAPKPVQVPGEEPGCVVTAKGCRPDRRAGFHTEPIEQWVALAKQAEAMLLARADLRRGQPIPPRRFAAMMGALPDGLTAPGVAAPSTPPGWSRVPEDDDGKLLLNNPVGKIGAIRLRAALSKEASIGVAVRGWLEIGGARPFFKWAETDFVMTIEADTLFGAIALRLAGEISNSRPLVRCAYCGSWYLQKRRNTFCCGDPLCNRDRRAENKRRQRVGLARPARSVP